MPDRDFIKGSCQQCGGHLEFPADAVGSSITCPHCGWSTELEGPAGMPKPAQAPQIAPTKVVGAGPSGLGGLLAGLGVLLLCGAIAGGYVYWQQEHGGGTAASGSTPVVSHTNAPPPSQTMALPKPEAKAVAETNQFAVLPYKLEKTEGSSLVYVTGTVRNLSDQQRFGVKVEFDLLDANGNAVGTASDYQAMMDPHGEWKFKALVIESKTVSAKFGWVAETQ